jgi:hypothetical protein
VEWSAQGLTQLDPEVFTPVIVSETESRALGRLTYGLTAEDVVLRRCSPGHCVFWHRKKPAAASVIYRGHRRMWVAVVVLFGGAKQKIRSAVWGGGWLR